MAHQIVTLPGDGIGPEIMGPTLELLSRVVDFEAQEHVFGGASIDAHGTGLTDDVTYTYVLVAVDTHGNRSAPSAIVSATPPLSLPRVPRPAARRPPGRGSSLWPLPHSSESAGGVARATRRAADHTAHGVEQSRVAVTSEFQSRPVKVFGVGEPEQV